MPRKRNKENKGLPLRWKKAHGAYYYQVPIGCEHLWDNKKLFRLGKTLPESYREWASRIDFHTNCRTLSDLLDRYLLEVVPLKVSKTQRDYRVYISRLREAFGDMVIVDEKGDTSFRASDAYKYVDKRSNKDSGKREIKVLSHLFTKAVEWGEIDRNPIKGNVTLPCAPPRDRYIEDWEVEAMLSLKSTRKKGSVAALKAYIKLKILTGLRKGDILRIQEKHMDGDGIHVKTGKSSKSVIFTWTDDLREAIAEARQARPVDISPFLFCNRFGKSYFNEVTRETSSFDSIWQRFKRRIYKETDVTQFFTEHDLRAKSGSDSDSDGEAQKLLTHSDMKTTVRFYRRKPQKVAPLR